jgi:hypothetical protein
MAQGGSMTRTTLLILVCLGNFLGVCVLLILLGIGGYFGSNTGGSPQKEVEQLKPAAEPAKPEPAKPQTTAGTSQPYEPKQQPEVLWASFPTVFDPNNARLQTGPGIAFRQGDLLVQIKLAAIWRVPLVDIFGKDTVSEDDCLEVILELLNVNPTNDERQL